MELWIILTKLALIGYISYFYVVSQVTNLPWILFCLLLYFCMNITFYIVKSKRIQEILVLLSITLTLLSFNNVQPLFLLLLPINLYELIQPYTHKKWVILVTGLLPAFFIRNDLVAFYGLVSIVSLIIFTMSEQYKIREEKSENQLDKMRRAIQKLTQSLNENNEYIRQSEYTFKLEERNRLSQEIHDKIGHSMTGALIQMEAAKRLMGIDKEKAIEFLQNAIHISKDGIDNIRITLKNMKPAIEQIGINRVKLFIDDFSAQHDIKVPFVYRGNIEMISPIQWKIIHENITEALTNALKYSHATAISIEIQVLNKLIKVEVKDNGTGTVKIKKGLGIIGMEERAASINGKVIVDGSIGFSVTTLLPLV